MQDAPKQTVGFWATRLVFYIILILFGLVMIFPLLYMVVASLKSSQDYQANPRRLLPYTAETGSFADKEANLYEFKVDGETQIYLETVTKANPKDLNKVRFGLFARPQDVEGTLENVTHAAAGPSRAHTIALEIPLSGIDANGEDFSLTKVTTPFILKSTGAEIERTSRFEGKEQTVIYQSYDIYNSADGISEPTLLTTYLDSGNDDENRNPILNGQVNLVAYANAFGGNTQEMQIVLTGEREFTDSEGKERAYPVYQVTYGDKTGELILVFANPIGVLVGQDDPTQVVYAEHTLANQVESIEFQFGNYNNLLELEKFDRALVNTVFVTVLVVLGQLATSIMGGYAFSRINFKGRNAIFMFYLGSIMIPFVVLIVPMYRLMVEIGWQSRIVSLIVPWIFSAYGTFLMRQFFMSIPIEIEEAALLDGCSRFRILWQIFVPLSTPAIATQGIFTFLYAWNSFLWPLFMFGDKPSDSRVLTLALISLANRASSGEPNLVFTGAAVTILPPVIIFILAQKYFVEGIATSGLKG